MPTFREEINLMKKIVPILILLLLCGCSANKAPEYSSTLFMMDTVCAIRIDGKSSPDAISAAFDRISEIEAATDYYSEDSEVSAINRAAAGEVIPLGDDLFNILKACLSVCEKSEGAFDITIAPLKDAWNFSAENPAPPTDDAIAQALSLVDYKQLILDEQNKTLTKTSSACKIDLGAAAKGYAADCAAEVLREHDCRWAVIDLGGNICVVGKNPARRNGEWIIGLQEPFADSGEYFTTVSITDGAVVTAGVYQRYFEYDGNIYHHILDTDTGFPCDNGLESASIKTDSALMADCLSTACLALGSDAGHSLADEFGANLITR